MEVGGVDFLPIPGSMLVAPSRAPAVSVRVRGQTSATCSSVDWPQQALGCWQRQHPSGVPLLGKPGPSHRFFSMGMTLERCSTHCAEHGTPYFMVAFESGKSDECGCVPEIVHADSTNFIQEDIDKCGRPCSGDASQLCGGRADASGSDTRYASIYKVVTDRPIGQRGSVATLPCQVGIFEPQFDSTGVFPSKVSQP